MTKGFDRQQINRKGVIALTAVALTASSFAFAAVKADAQTKNEEFHSSRTKMTPEQMRAEAVRKATTVQENPMGKQGPLAMMSDQNDPKVRWFENFDKTVVINSKTASEVAILTRPLNQEAERVQEWTDTAARVAGKYKYLAMTLRHIEIPGGSQDLKQYSNLTADWYADAANVYDELIKPRRAARTMEELEDGLNQIQNKAKTLESMQKTLKQMDMDLRKKYHVHMRQEDDALQQYVKGNPTEAEIKRVGGQLPR